MTRRLSTFRQSDVARAVKAAQAAGLAIGTVEITPDGTIRVVVADICLYLGPAARAELQALIANRNTSRKLVWRAEIILATSEGHGTFEIMRRARTSKPTVWRWQQRYLDEGVAGLKRDKTRPLRVPPLPMETRLKVIAKTVQETPPNATHWSRALEPRADGRSHRHLAVKRWSHLGGSRLEAASHEGVQGLERPDVRGEGHGYRRTLSRPS